MAGVGVVILFWTVIKLLGNIEHSFNHIWGVEKARTIKRKFADYLSVMLICPLLVVMSGSLTIYLSTQLEKAGNENAAIGTISHALQYVIGFLPLVVLCAVFTFLYMFFPNTKVRFYAGMISGILTAVLFQALQWVYINSQIGISHYNAIYGSFAALPLFLIWLYLSWMIVLFGAEFSYAQQNASNYEFEPQAQRASLRFRNLLALRITQICVQEFQHSKPPPDEVKIQKLLRCPAALVRSEIERLIVSGVLVRVLNNNDETTAFHPACPVEQLTAAEVLRLLELNGSSHFPVCADSEFQRISELLENFDIQIAQSSENRPLGEL